MKNAQACKLLAKHMGWKWDGCSLDSYAKTHTAMFHDGYWPLVIPMSLVRLAIRGIAKELR